METTKKPKVLKIFSGMYSWHIKAECGNDLEKIHKDLELSISLYPQKIHIEYFDWDFSGEYFHGEPRKILKLCKICFIRNQISAFMLEY